MEKIRDAGQLSASIVVGLEQSVREIVAEVAFLIARESNTESLLWSVANIIATKLGFIDCVIYTADDNELLLQRAAAGPKSSDDHVVLDPIQLKIGQGVVGAAAESGEVIRVTDTRLDSRYVVDDEIRLSELAVPIILNGRVLGVIDSEHPSLGFYTERHEQAIKIISSLLVHRIASAMEMERLHQEIRMLRSKLRSPKARVTSSQDGLTRIEPSIPASRPVVGRDVIFLQQKFRCRTQKMCSLLGINMSTWSQIKKNEDEPIANVSVALTVRLLDVYPGLANDNTSFTMLLQALEFIRGGKVTLQEVAVMLGKDRTTASAWRRGTQPSDAVVSLYKYLINLSQCDPTGLNYYKELVNREARSRNLNDIWSNGSWSSR